MALVGRSAVLFCGPGEKTSLKLVRATLEAAKAEAARKEAARKAKTGRRTATRPVKAFGHFDLVDDVFFRQGSGPTRSAKQCPQVKLVPILQVLARGWHRTDTSNADLAKRSDRVIHDGGGKKWPLTSLVRLWNAVVADAGLDADVIRHMLRHTAATWLLEDGYSIEETAEFLGVTTRELLTTYAHVDTAFTVEVAEAVDRYVAADRGSRLRRMAEIVGKKTP